MATPKFFKISPGEFISPMEKGLSNDGRDGEVVERLVFTKTELDELASKSAFGACKSKPSGDLAGVVIGPSSQKETAVPLEPTPWVLGVNPSTILPVSLAAATGNPVKIDILGIL